MFRFSTILRELVQSLAKVIFQLKHTVKLRRVYYVQMWQHVMERCACTTFHDIRSHRAGL